MPPAKARVEPCRSCGAAVFFARNRATGKWLCLGADPDPDAGNVLVVNRAPSGRLVGIVLTDDAAATKRAEGLTLYRAHHRSVIDGGCPGSQEWRDRARAAVDA